MKGEELWQKHATKRNYCSSTDSSQQTIRLCSYSKLTASHPSIIAPSRYHSRPQKYLLKWGKSCFLLLFFFATAQWKKEKEGCWKKLALSQTWMDSAQLIKIKRFNSREIEAVIQCARHVEAILISSQPAHSSTFWCKTIFCIFNYTLQRPSNYQNQAHLHDWNIIMVYQKNTVLFWFLLQSKPPHPPSCFLAEINLQWRAYKQMH